MSYFPSSTPEAASDAFARQRVSEPSTLFDATLEYDKSPLFWNETTSGTAVSAHQPNESSVLMSVGTDSGDSIVRRTLTFHRYQPGKSQLVLVTFNLRVQQANCRKRVGYMDNLNGVWFENNGAGNRFVMRSNATGSPVDTVVAQASWNIDPFDGTGPSGVTLDITKVQILIIDLEWLGVGRVRVGFVVDGMIYYAHEFLQANVGTTVYMTTANLPISYEIENTAGTALASALLAICATVISEGGFENPRAIGFTAGNGATATSVNARQAVVSIRPKQFFGSKINRGQIILKDVAIYASGNPCYWEIIYKPTSITSASYSSVDDASITQASTAGTTVTGGLRIASGYVAASNQVRSSIKESLDVVLPITLDMSGSNPIAVALVATGIGGASSINASINWNELR